MGDSMNNGLVSYTKEKMILIDSNDYYCEQDDEKYCKLYIHIIICCCCYLPMLSSFL